LGDARSPFGRFKAHPLRDRVLNEIHARPFQMLATPRRVAHFGFTTTPESAAEARHHLAERCTALGAAPPGDQTRHHVAAFDGVILRWETHSEVTTYMCSPGF
jgi:uncharacterized membrane-anchored protein